jgi:hypothetical protein
LLDGQPLGGEIDAHEARHPFCAAALRLRVLLVLGLCARGRRSSGCGPTIRARRPVVSRAHGVELRRVACGRLQMVMRFNDHPFGGNWSESVGSKVRAASLPFAPLGTP